MTTRDTIESDVPDLLTIVGPLPFDLVARLADPPTLERWERAGTVVVRDGDGLVDLGDGANHGDAVTGVRRRRALALLVQALDDGPLGAVAPDTAQRVGLALVEAGGAVRAPLITAMRAALLLGRLDEAITIATHAHAAFPDDHEVTHLVAMTHEARGHHGSASAVLAGGARDAASVGRWWSNMFVSLRGTGEPPPLDDVGDQHNELLANQSWIEIVDGDVAAVARSTTTVINDARSSPQAVFWACISGAMGAALDARGDVTERMQGLAADVLASTPHRLTPFAGLQLDLVSFLSDVRLGHLAPATTLAELRRHDAPAPFLAAVWSAMRCLALRECGRYAEAVAAFEESLPTFTGDNFGLITWARSEHRACAAMHGIDVPHAPAVDALGLYRSSATRNEAWVHAAAGDITTALSLVDDALAQALALGQNAPAMLAVIDMARFGAEHRAATRLTDLTELAAPIMRVGSDAVLAFASTDPEAALRAHRAASELGLEPLASELGAWARRTASVHGPVALARVELWTDVHDHRTPRLRATPVPTVLTSRERDVARRAADGATSRAIADELGVSVRTVDNLLARTYDKCAVRSRAELLTM